MSCNKRDSSKCFGNKQGHAGPCPKSKDHFSYDDVAEVKKNCHPNKTLLKHLVEEFIKSRRNLVLRVIFGAILISCFVVILYLGPFALLILCAGIQIGCYREVMEITSKYYMVKEPQVFKSLSWYFFFISNYFCYGETLFDYCSDSIKVFELLSFMITYHRFIAFCLYVAGIILFVLCLKKKYGTHQFSLLACTHLALVLIVAQSYMVVQNIFQGIIWLTVPASIVICNDIMAYFFGKLFGRTPLIEVSPKKTWEGFIGGGISTVIYGCVAAYALCQCPHFTCPTEYAEELGRFTVNPNCKPHEVFQLTDYSMSFVSQHLQFYASIKMYPFIIHTMAFSLFGSIIAPFGGFFASGFKRAFKVKDFSETIPGHGGVLDRFDCQFLMITFVNVYITSFIKHIPTESILSRILYLEASQQVEFYYLLKDTLAL